LTQKEDVIAPGSTREQVWALAELLLGAAIVYAANVLKLLPINETPWLLAAAWISLRRRKTGWRTLGLRSPGSWRTTFALAVAAGVLLQLLSEYVTEPLLYSLTHERPDLSDFRSLTGNLPAAAGMLLLVWTLAAFGEEIAYRGFLLERAASIKGGSTTSYVFAVVATSLLFGIGHYYQGPAGVAGSAVSGLTFGALFLLSGRNLWLPILAHGISDTIGLVMIYFGLYRWDL
jgi:membrane protease YdiL (CAAX protease family)